MHALYKKYIRLFLLVITLGTPCCALDSEPEIIIELTGEPTSTSSKEEIFLWDKNDTQLAKLLSGKTREDALRLITSVSAKDSLMLGNDGTRYRFVQYGREGGYYKLLFLAKEPQLFIACATTTQQTLDLAARFQVSLDLTEEEFLETYSKESSAVFLPLDNGLSLYELALPQKTPQFFLFEKKILKQILNKTEADQLVKKQKDALTAQQKKASQPAVSKPAPAKPYKALLIGGTLEDQLYMPRVVTPNTLLLSPTGNPSGTESRSSL